MDDYWSKARTFVRFCMQLAIHRKLELQDFQICHLYKEIIVMTDYFNDKQTMMEGCNKLGLLFEQQERFEEAIEYQQLHLSLAESTQNRKHQMAAYGNLGNAYKSTNNIPQALSCFEELKVIALDVGNKEIEAVCYFSLGCLYHEKIDQQNKALEYFKKLLELAIETKNVFYQKMGYAYMARAHEALKAIPETIDCYLEYLKISPQDDQDKYSLLPNMDASAYNRLGELHLSLGELQKALDYFGKDLELAISFEDQASAFENLGEVYVRMGENSKAFENSFKALEMFSKLNNREGEASASGLLGYVYKRKGDYHSAIEYYKRQLEICTNIASKVGQAEACQSLGNVYNELGNYYETIKWYKKGLDICIEIGNEKGVAKYQLGLGNTYSKLGQRSEAIEHYKKSLDMARKVNDRYWEGGALMNLGATNFNLEKVEEAEKYFKDCLAIALEIGDRNAEAKAYGNLSRCKAELGQYDKALELAEKQIDLSVALDFPDSLGLGYGNKGNLYDKINDYEQAVFCYENALKNSRDLGNKRGEADYLSALGKTFVDKAFFHKMRGEEREYQVSIAKAIHFLKEGLLCLEWVFEHIQDQDHFKISILDIFIHNYNMLTLTYLSKFDFQKALEVTERGRARALDDLLTSKYGIHKTSPLQQDHKPLSYGEIENMASGFSILFYNIFQQLDLYFWVINQDDLVHVHKHAFSQKTSFSDIVTSAYSTLKVREVKCEDRLIETAQHEQSTMSLKASSIQMSEDLLTNTFKRCVPDEDLCPDDVAKPLEVLYKVLISPVLDKLTKDEIVIIPDGSISMVPFAALQDHTGAFLSETKRIRLAPSLTSLKTLKDSPADFHSKSGALIIGNPHVGEVIFRSKKISISKLPCAQREAEMIGKLLGVQPILGEQATKEAIKRNLREGVAVIHFAAHGTRDGEIFLAPPPTVNQSHRTEAGDILPTPPPTNSLPSEPDYILTMKEVQDSRVRPQLVVLSCCHSGRGEIKAEGVVGMSRAFLAAGARAVLASLWAIDDKATMVFMEKFYNHLKAGESASKSLQQAMKEMREIPTYSEPMFWAPFFLIGDDVTVKI